MVPGSVLPGTRSRLGSVAFPIRRISGGNGSPLGRSQSVGNPNWRPSERNTMATASGRLVVGRGPDSVASVLPPRRELVGPRFGLGGVAVASSMGSEGEAAARGRSSCRHPWLFRSITPSQPGLHLVSVQFLPVMKRLGTDRHLERVHRLVTPGEAMGRASAWWEPGESRPGGGRNRARNWSR